MAKWVEQLEKEKKHLTDRLKSQEKEVRIMPTRKCNQQFSLLKTKYLFRVYLWNSDKCIKLFHLLMTFINFFMCLSI